jgi:hypothetical protein
MASSNYTDVLPTLPKSAVIKEADIETGSSHSQSMLSQWTQKELLEALFANDDRLDEGLLAGNRIRQENRSPKTCVKEERRSVLLCIPLDLEFDFLGTVLAFVFDVVGGSDGDVEALPGDLDFEGLAFFKAVGEAAEFLDELMDRIGLFDVAVFHRIELLDLKRERATVPL